MIILVDTDVLLDVALDRTPFADPASRVLDYLQANPGTGVVAWHSIANVYYLLRSPRGADGTRAFIRDLLGFVRVVSGGTADVLFALALPMADLEDALQVAAARAGGADVIVTRNAADFRRAPIAVASPAEVLRRLGV